MCPHTCQNVNMSLFILIHRAFSQQKCFTDEQFKTAKSKVVHQAIFLQGPLIILPWETSKLDVAMSFPDLCQSVCAWSLSFSERRMLHGNQRWHQISHWFIGKHLSFFFFFPCIWQQYVSTEIRKLHFFGGVMKCYLVNWPWHFIIDDDA